MNGNQDMQILEALTELRNQIIVLRTTLNKSLDNDSSTEDSVIPVDALNRASKKEDYRIEVTPQEMNELLFTPPADPTVYHSPVPSQDSYDEIMKLSKCFTKFKNQTDQELNELKKSVKALSELFGRHELEIHKSKK